MKTLLLIASILFVVGPLKSKAQTKKLDSIKLLIKEYPREDTIRVSLLVDYVLNAVNINTSEALPIMQEVVMLSKKLNYTKGIELGYIYLQFYYSDRGDFTASMTYADTAIQYLERDTATIAKINVAYLYHNLGGDYMKMGDFQSAIYYFTKAAGILEKYKPEVLGSVYGGVAAVYEELSQLDKAFEYDRKAIAAVEKTGDKTSLARRYLNYAERLIKQKDITEAENILKKIEPLVLETKDVIAEALFYQNRGFINQNKKRYSEAVSDFRTAYKIGLDNDDKYQQVALLDPLIKSLMEAGIMQESKDMNDTLLSKSLEYHMNFGRRNAYENYAKWYYLNQDFATAYKFLEMKMLLSDSISSDEVKEKITMAETRYKVASKDREIKSLQDEKQIQLLQLHQKNTLNYILIGSAISLFIFLLLGYRNYTHRQKLQQAKIDELETEKQLTATEAILKGEEQERSRLAKDLHDGLGGMLSGIKYSLNNMKENLIMTPQNANTFEHSINMLDNSINEMRRVAHNLMPESLLKFGLDDALEDFCNEINRNGILKVVYQSFDLKDKSIDQSLSVTIYRIIQELLNNIVKHAAAKQAIVQVSAADNQITLTVEDDGKGFDRQLLQNVQGIGWKNIMSRVDYHKGKINLQSEPHKGTSIFIEF
ncbi:MAG TPA: tetratricopeptide repeat protein [Flavipsychrobacter sp.]|nr:tetratricopeptide repeat protein [Flavipsychrobacter sp.]